MEPDIGSSFGGINVLYFEYIKVNPQEPPHNKWEYDETDIDHDVKQKRTWLNEVLIILETDFLSANKLKSSISLHYFAFLF